MYNHIKHATRKNIATPPNAAPTAIPTFAVGEDVPDVCEAAPVSLEARGSVDDGEVESLDVEVYIM